MSTGIGGAVTAHVPPRQQQAAPDPTKSRISNDLRVSSEFVVIQSLNVIALLQYM